MRYSYPNNINKEQLEPIRAFLEQAKKKTKLRVVGLL